MPMSTTQMAATLFQLQQLDLELERLIAEQQALMQTLQGDSSVKRARMENQIAQQQLQTGLQAQQEAEWALEDLNRRVQMLDQRLYSGAITNPKELYAVQQEVQHLRAQQNRQEEMTLEMMDATEVLQEMAARKSEALGRAEEAWTKGNAAKQQRYEQLDARRQELQAARAQLALAIEAGLLARYDTLRRAKQGRAVSKVEQNSCQWCRVLLTASELQRVRQRSDLQTCSNCGRILYYER